MIICCGEALIDMLPRESTAGEPAFAPYAGGAVFNTAIALGRLGVPVEFFSGLSSDLFGQQLRDVLAASNVGSRYADILGAADDARLRASDRRPRDLHVLRREHRRAHARPRPTCRRSTPRSTRMLFGAISLIPEPCGSTYEALMRREHGTRVIMLDPNIRPDFIPDKDEAPRPHAPDDRAWPTSSSCPTTISPGSARPASPDDDRRALAGSRAEADHRHRRQQGRRRLHQAITRSRSRRER